MPPFEASPSRPSSPWWLFPCFAMLSVASHAQPFSPAVLDPIVVTASRSPQRLLDLVADVTVIDADEIVRGANAAQTLVLIDGMRVASASSGATALEAIPVEQIERIEILRGPASSLYGADAIGGVIQVFTRRGASGFSANASAGYGTFDTWSVAAGLSGGNAAARGSVEVGNRESRGFN